MANIQTMSRDMIKLQLNQHFCRATKVLCGATRVSCRVGVTLCCDFYTFGSCNTLICSLTIFKFREDKSNNVFREILKCFRKTAKFEFFAKQIIYLESPDHPLQNDI